MTSIYLYIHPSIIYTKLQYFIFYFPFIHDQRSCIFCSKNSHLPKTSYFTTRGPVDTRFLLLADLWLMLEESEAGKNKYYFWQFVIALFCLFATGHCSENLNEFLWSTDLKCTILVTGSEMPK